LLLPYSLSAQRQMEKLDRGVVAVATHGGALVSWRIFGDDGPDMAYNLYQSINGSDAELVNAEPILGKSNYLIPSVNTSDENEYFIRPVVDGTEGEASKSFILNSSNIYMSVPIDKPADDALPNGTMYSYHANDCSVGDLNGDGQYEIIVKWMPSNAADNMPSFTGNTILDAYTLEGEKLWRIELGNNIRSGPHYTQFMVYDLDGDGIAEVACKTAPGTKDGTGNYLSKGPAADADHTADYRNSGGMILSGPEYLTIFNGRTGKEMFTTYYTPRRHPDTEDPTGEQLNEIWGDSYGNRVDRFLACIAYLDGVRPSLVMCRGYYTRTVVAAYDFRGGELKQRWVFDTMDEGNEAYKGQGDHNLSVADVDGDGKDEIVYGSMVVDDDGSGLYSTGLGHGDAMHVSDLDPNHPGLEIFQVHEDHGNGSTFRDLATGEILWQHKKAGWDIGRGVAFDIDPNYPGAECWSSDGDGIYSCATGEVITTTYPQSSSGSVSYNAGIWWDGDLLRELYDRTIISKWNWDKKSTDRKLTVYNYGISNNNSTKSNPCLIADILGDWREELICRTSDNTELRIFTTPYESEYGIYTLMHDPQYRLSIAWQNVGYNQPAHTGFFLGDGMETPPVTKNVYVDPFNTMPFDYYQSKDTMGFVVMQAEDFTSSSQGVNSDSWSEESNTDGFYEKGYMTAPSVSSYAPHIIAQKDAPKLSYSIDFRQTGEHYVWARFNFPDRDANAMYYGIDGTINSDGQRFKQSNKASYNQWVWGEGAESIIVDTIGMHEFEIYAQDQGAKLDMLIITKDPDFDPGNLPDGYLLGYNANTKSLWYEKLEAPAACIDSTAEETFELPDYFVKYSTVDVFENNAISYSQTPPVKSVYHPLDVVDVDINATDYFGNSVNSQLEVTIKQYELPDPFEGFLFIQAEDYSSLRQGTNVDDWSLENNLAGYYEDGFMTAPAVSSYAPYSTAVVSAPAMSYDVEFTGTGTYYVWGHVYFGDGASDSFYYGLDGKIAGDNSKIAGNSGLYGKWVWLSGMQSITVDEVGPHTFTIYAREKNVTLDMLVLTYDPDYTPSTLPDDILLGSEITTKSAFTDIQDDDHGILILSKENGIVIRAEERISNVSVYDIMGRLLTNKDGSSSEEFIPLSKSGIYIVKAVCGQNSVSRKIVK